MNNQPFEPVQLNPNDQAIINQLYSVASDGRRRRDPRTVVNTERKYGPNEKCPCNAGKKYKKCCQNGVAHA